MVLGWFRKKQPIIDPNNFSKAVGDIIADYGEFLERNSDSMVIRDEKQLPHEKEIILKVLCIAIARRDTRPELREALIVSALSLSKFQKDVGDDLHPLGFDFSRLATMNTEDSLKLIGSNPVGKAKYDRMLPVVKADADRIFKQVRAAEAVYPV
jgi:hypothetical protein